MSEFGVLGAACGVLLVPRWNGDTNFMSIVGQVRVIPDALEDMAKQYRETSAALNLPHDHSTQ